MKVVKKLTESWIGVKEAIQRIKEYDPETAITENALRRWIKEDKLSCAYGPRDKIIINWEDLVEFLGDENEEVDSREKALKDFFQNYYDPQAGFLCDNAFVNRLARDTLKFLNNIKEADTENNFNRTVLKDFNNCNCCNKYNQQSTVLSNIHVEETSCKICEYAFGNMLVRICDNCAKQLIDELKKQIKEG